MKLRHRDIDGRVATHAYETPTGAKFDRVWDTLPLYIIFGTAGLGGWVLWLISKRPLFFMGWFIGTSFAWMVILTATLYVFWQPWLRPVNETALRELADTPDKVTPLEAEYCRTVAALLEQNTLSDEAGREVVAALNTLLQSSRRLDERQKELQTILTADDAPSLRDEEARLTALLDTETDPAHRATLEQLRDLNRARQGNEAALTQNAERFRLRQEVILQTFVGLRGTLIRARLAQQSSEGADALTAQTESTIIPAQSVQDVVTRLQQQARSIEAATQELTSFAR